MNLSNRLKRIEKKLIKTFSAFCLCYGNDLKYEVIPITLDEWKRRFDAGEETAERLPDFCDGCRKPVDKRSIEITFERLQETTRQRLNGIIKRKSNRFDN
jgi:hypothetical protein